MEKIYKLSMNLLTLGRCGTMWPLSVSWKKMPQPHKSANRKLKSFVCAFAGDHLKSDLNAGYNQDLTKSKAVDFNDLVEKLRRIYQQLQNQVLLHYRFHQLQPATSEKTDSFINTICQHAESANLNACTSRNASHETLIRDQIIMGTKNTTILEQTLEKELNLTALIFHARKVEVTEEAAKFMDFESSISSFQLNSMNNDAIPPTSVNKIGKKAEVLPSQKAQRRENLYETQKFPQTTNRILSCAGCGQSNCDR